MESLVLGPPPPLTAATLVGFGARRRGFHAKVAIPSMDRAEVGQTEVPDSVPPGCIRITNAESRDGITYHGDCGTVFIDLDCNGIYFHHTRTQREPWKHPQLGGTSETPEEYDVRDCGDRDVKNRTSCSPFPSQILTFMLYQVHLGKLDEGSIKWNEKVCVFS